MVAPRWCWRIHRARKEPRRTALALGFILGTGVCSYLGFREPLWSTLAVVLLLGAAAEFFLPVTYRLTEEGVEKVWLGGRTSLPWRRVRRAVWGEQGIFLSPFPHSSRWDGLRGLYLPFGDEVPRQEVIAWIRRRLEEAHSHASTG